MEDVKNTPEDELVIDQSNFDQYFFDIRKFPPKKGQVMAIYTAIAEFVDGTLKRDIIYLLAMTSKVNESILLLRKLGWASEGDAIRVCREIAQDLKNGMQADDVANKVHKYKLQACYYTDPKLIPKDDPHWSFVEFKNLDEHLAKVEHTGKGTVTSKVIVPENEEIPIPPEEEDNKNEASS